MKFTMKSASGVTLPRLRRHLQRAALSAGLLLAATSVSGQITELTWTFSGTVAGGWNTLSNWTDGVTEPNVLLPDANTHVLFNSAPGVHATTFINFNTAIAGSPIGERNVGAISLLATDTLGRAVRGNNALSSGVGNLITHGIMVFMTSEAYPGIPPELDGQVVRLLYANHTTDQALELISGSTTTNGTAEVTMIMKNSGVIYARGPDSRVRITNRMIRDGDPIQLHCIMGGGILHFGTRAQNSDYGGGIIIENAIVEYTNSGDRATNPWGGNDGPIVIRDVTFRSTSDTSGRTLIGPLVIRGNLGLAGMAAPTMPESRSTATGETMRPPWSPTAPLPCTTAQAGTSRSTAPATSSKPARVA